MPDPEFDAWITRVREATDIVEVIGQAVPLRKKGRKYWGLCPFHSEKTPSFSVDPEQQLYYCFGCHRGGTVFTFLEAREGLTFLEGVRRLAQAAGIAEPERAGARGRRRDRTLEDVVEWTGEYFTRERETIEPFLAERKLSWAMADRFGLGYAPDQWQGLVDFLRARGVKDDAMVAAGVAIARPQGGVYDRWRHRLTFPIWDRAGRVVAFGGRALRAGQEPKYINSPETPLFKKGQVLYGMPLARARWREGALPLLVEGYFDVIACHQAGLTQAVASLGTALTAAQARLLGRYGGEVDLLYDEDGAGQEAAQRAFLVLSEVGLKVNLVRLGDGSKDPDEYRRAQGDQALRNAVDGRIPYLTAVVERLSGSTPREKAKAVETVRPLLAAVGDPVERAGYVEIIARRLHVDPLILAQSLGRSQADKHTSGKNRHNMGRAGPKAVLPSLEVRLVALLLRHPETVGEVRRRVPEWAESPTVAPILDRLEHFGAAVSAAWIDEIEPGCRAMVLEAMAWEGPDGGNEAIGDYLERLEARIDQARWQALVERVRAGETAESVMREVREAAERMNRHKWRKEG